MLSYSEFTWFLEIPCKKDNKLSSAKFDYIYIYIHTYIIYMFYCFNIVHIQLQNMCMECVCVCIYIYIYIRQKTAKTMQSKSYPFHRKVFRKGISYHIPETIHEYISFDGPTKDDSPYLPSLQRGRYTLINP